jgi:hypothetical protein
MHVESEEIKKEQQSTLPTLLRNLEIPQRHCKLKSATMMIVPSSMKV